MKSIQDIMATVARALREDPRPCCLHCLGITSEQLCEQVEKHVRENLSDVYTIKNGTCHKRDHQARVIHPRDEAKPLPKL